MRDWSVLRWVLAVAAALAIVGLLAYARGHPGNGNRFPDRKSLGSSAPVLIHGVVTVGGRHGA